MKHFIQTGKRTLSWALTLALLLGVFPASGGLTAFAAAQETIDLGTLTDDASGDGYSYTGGVLVIENGANVIIEGTSTDKRIEVGGTANITLNGVNLNCSDNFQSAMKLNSGANVTLTLAGDSTLAATGDFGFAGIGVHRSATLTITGTGSLTATGKTYESAGIGSYGDGNECGTIIITGGVTVTAIGGDSAGSAGIGTSYNVGTVTINGSAMVTAMAGGTAMDMPGIGAKNIYIGTDKSAGENGTVTVTATGSGAARSSALAGTVTAAGLYDYTRGTAETKNSVFTNNGSAYVQIRPPVIDTTPPEASLSATSYGTALYAHHEQAGRVKIYYPSMQIDFNKPMNTAPGTVTVTPKAGGAAVDLLSIIHTNLGSDAFPQIQLNFGESLAYNTAYTVSIDGYKDTYGNEMVPFSHDFITEYKPIDEMTIEVNEPEIGEELETDIVSHDGDEKGYTISDVVTWTPNETVRGDSEYIAEVTLTRTDAKYKFEDQASINGHPATVEPIGTDGASVKVSATFNTGDTPVSPDVTITAPAADRIPDETATPVGEGYTAGAVTWSPSDDPFKGNTVYTATVTLTAKEKYTLVVPFTVNGQEATSVTANQDGTVTLTFAFPATGPSGIVIIPSTNHGDTAFINLTEETITLPEGFTVAAFSTDGGTKWRRGALPVAAKFPRMLNKGMTLHVTNQFDAKEKKPAADAATITFPEIGERPKRNPDRLAPFYGSSHWGLAPRGSTEASAMVFANLEYAASTDGKTPNSDGWISLAETQAQGGIAIASSGRNTFIFRIAPTATTPASPVWRVRPANFSKAPSYKIRDIKDGNAKVKGIAFRRGDQYAFGMGEDPVLTFNAPLADKATLTVAVLREESQAANTDAVDIYIRRAATGKRPPSLPQKLTSDAPPPADPTPAT